MTRTPKPKSSNPFRYFRLAVMLYVRYPLSLRNVDDLLVERGIDVCHETVRLWWNRFGPLFGVGPSGRTWVRLWISTELGSA